METRSNLVLLPMLLTISSVMSQRPPVILPGPLCPPPTPCPPPICPPNPPCPPPQPCPPPAPVAPCKCNCVQNVYGPELPQQCKGKSSKRCEWKVIFKALAGNGRDVSNDFTNPGQINENVPGANDPETDVIFRDVLLDNWNNLDRNMRIKEVKIDVYNQGQLKATFRFDARRSDMTSWFSQANLISSPYRSLKGATLITDSFAGLVDATRNRIFYLDEISSTGCQFACGFLVVVDNDSPSSCVWETTGPRPLFYYGDPTLNSCTVFQTQGQVADKLVISAKVCEH